MKGWPFSQVLTGKTTDLNKLSLRGFLKIYFRYPTIQVYCLLAALSGGIAVWLSRGVWSLLYGIFLVVLAYPWIEYFIHRYILHGKFLYKSPWTASQWKRVHYDHHQDPNELRVLFAAFHMVLPTILLLTVPMGWLVLGGAAGIFSLLTAGFLAMLYYEFCHTLQHLTFPPKSSYLRTLRKRHHVHHFHNETGNFGIATSLADRLFGTLLPEADIPKSPTVFNLGYYGEEMERYPWLARLSGQLPVNPEESPRPNPFPTRKQDT